MGKFLKDCILAGILITLPTIFTFYIVFWIFGLFDSIVMVPLNQDNILRKIPGAGVVILLIIMLIIGAIGKNFVGKFFIKIFDAIINKIPVVKSIYAIIKQIFDTVLSPNANSFKEVVLFEYPRKDSWTLAFVTSRTKGEIQEKTLDEVVSVYVPTTPNPTSGFLLFIPQKDLIPLKMKPEIAMKLIVSGGIISEKDKEIILNNDVEALKASEDLSTKDDNRKEQDKK